MGGFRKTECFIPTCPVDGSDLLDAEGYVPHYDNPWVAPADPDFDQLHCGRCQPTPADLGRAPVEAIVVDFPVEVRPGDPARTFRAATPDDCDPATGQLKAQPEDVEADIAKLRERGWGQ